MKYDLEGRLIEFAVAVIDVAESIPKTRAGNHLAGQLIRSGTSPALHYGEVQSAESRNDFIHKMKVVLKELRETRVGLAIITKRSMSRTIESVARCSNECSQLIAIVAKSLQTAERNRK
ncbi:MAG: four helix bundle protein [Bacteroidota bacterium]